jgi:aryl-alcohol dehydrogenase-like predicted oxidoreductase
MTTRPLGRTGIQVPPLCFGGNVFGWTVDEAASHALLDRMVDAGLTFIDTADVYSAWVPGNRGGESETIIGTWLASRKRRADVTIATKLGHEMGPGMKGLRPAYVRDAIEASLRRLRTDHVDLYQSHADDEETPIEDTLAVYADLIREGKVRAIGASNYSAARLRTALDVAARTGLPRYETLQPHFNLYNRDPYEGPLEDLCRAEGLGVITYWSLARGFLTGKYRSEADLSKSPRGAGVAPFLNDRGFRILAALDTVAGQTGATQGQVALAWLMARPGVTAPIASATTPAQLDELVGAMRVTLDAATVALLDAAGA